MKRGGYSLLVLAIGGGCSEGVPGTKDASPPGQDGATQVVDAPAAGSDTGDAGEIAKVIGKSGGQVSSAEGRVSLVLAPGAVPEDTSFTVQPVSGVPAGTVGQAFEIGPTGTVFDRPVRLSFALTTAEQQMAGSDGLVVALAVDDKWEPLPVSGLAPDGKSIFTMVDHLSTYGVVKRPSLGAQAPRGNTCDAASWISCCNAVSGSSAGTDPPTCDCTYRAERVYEFMDCYETKPENRTSYCTKCIRNCCQQADGFLFSATTTACGCQVGGLDAGPRTDRLRSCLDNCILKGEQVPPTGKIQAGAGCTDTAECARPLYCFRPSAGSSQGYCTGVCDGKYTAPCTPAGAPPSGTGGICLPASSPLGGPVVPLCPYLCKITDGGQTATLDCPAPLACDASPATKGAPFHLCAF